MCVIHLVDKVSTSTAARSLKYHAPDDFIAFPLTSVFHLQLNRHIFNDSLSYLIIAGVNYTSDFYLRLVDKYAAAAVIAAGKRSF